MVGVVAGLCTLKANVFHDLVLSLTRAVGVAEDHLGRQVVERCIRRERPLKLEQSGSRPTAPSSTNLNVPPASIIGDLHVNKRAKVLGKAIHKRCAWRNHVAVKLGPGDRRGNVVAVGLLRVHCACANGFLCALLCGEVTTTRKLANALFLRHSHALGLEFGTQRLL